MLKWIGRLIGLAVLLVVLLLVVGVYGYATDYGLEAEVVSKSCSSSPPNVTVKTKVGGIEHTVDVDFTQCGVIQVGNFVVYHLQSERTKIFDREGGQCVYDTEPQKMCK